MPRRYDSADAKRRILTACVRFFLEKGYTRTTVAEIVKEADVSISTFQNVFRTKDNVLPNQRNGVYGHGRERYDAIEEILDANAGSIDREIAWQALQAASQAPNPQDVTSNTQWSILYDNTALTAEAVIRRDWNTKTSYDLVSNVAVTDVG